MADTVDENISLFPVWRQAVKDFLAANLEPGTVIPLRWFEGHFQMEPLDENAMLSAAEFRERQFTWLRNMDEFRRELLEEHQICLLSVHGEGYRIVPPGEQTGATTERFEREVKKAYRQAAVRLKNVQVDKLTEEQRKENVDAIARLAMLRGMHRAALE